MSLMLTLETFLKKIAGAKGDRSDAAVSEAAGLQSQAVAAMRRGKVPSLERAAAIADAVGLELVVRAKGEAINLFALRLAMLNVFVSHPMESYDPIDYLARRLVKEYPRFSKTLEGLPIKQQEAAFGYGKSLLLDIAARLHSADEIAALKPANRAFDAILEGAFADARRTEAQESDDE